MHPDIIGSILCFPVDVAAQVPFSLARSRLLRSRTADGNLCKAAQPHKAYNHTCYGMHTEHNSRHRESSRFEVAVTSRAGLAPGACRMGTRAAAGIARSPDVRNSRLPSAVTCDTIQQTTTDAKGGSDGRTLALLFGAVEPACKHAGIHSCAKLRVYGSRTLERSLRTECS